MREREQTKRVLNGMETDTYMYFTVKRSTVTVSRAFKKNPLLKRKLTAAGERINVAKPFFHIHSFQLKFNQQKQHENKPYKFNITKFTPFTDLI